ncbi:hypothetical protein niasHT_014946 [Heterodera trifolii]|uniref:Uncharacterized protein n=1 Tax=Heterodera trifolii TaxID=157864 RepID=A0ABD2LFW9_9BILA
MERKLAGVAAKRFFCVDTLYEADDDEVDAEELADAIAQEEGSDARQFWQRKLAGVAAERFFCVDTLYEADDDEVDAEELADAIAQEEGSDARQFWQVARQTRSENCTNEVTNGAEAGRRGCRALLLR